jgi:FixJ family two-component response regulator
LAEHKTIAVVDNNLHILQGLDLLLSSCGYHSKLFASAEEFLSAAPTLGAACVIVDIQLGHISGLELVRTLSAQGSALPVIFITASSNDLHQRQAMELGCAAFFPEPFSAERLIEAVAKATGSTLN